MTILGDESKSYNHVKNKIQQNGAKFRHLKDPFFILCCNTKAYRIIQERREDPFHRIPLDCTHKMTNNYIQVFFFLCSYIHNYLRPPPIMHAWPPCCRAPATDLCKCQNIT